MVRHDERAPEVEVEAGNGDEWARDKPDACESRTLVLVRTGAAQTGGTEEERRTHPRKRTHTHTTHATRRTAQTGTNADSRQGTTRSQVRLA